MRVLLLFASIVAGCSALQNSIPIDVPLDVWNRTLDPIFLVDQLGTRLDVPACGHASAASFRVNDYKVFAENVLWFGGGEGNVSGSEWHRFVISASLRDPIVSFYGNVPFPELPACAGHPTDLIPPSN